MSRESENRALRKYGYRQGDETAIEPTPCEICGRRVSKSRSWWRPVAPGMREFVCHCRPCAMMRESFSPRRRFTD